jgi:hypothetical protein
LEPIEPCLCCAISGVPFSTSLVDGHLEMNVEQGGFTIFLLRRIEHAILLFNL